MLTHASLSRHGQVDRGFAFVTRGKPSMPYCGEPRSSGGTTNGQADGHVAVGYLRYGDIDLAQPNRPRGEKSTDLRLNTPRRITERHTIWQREGASIPEQLTGAR